LCFRREVQQVQADQWRQLIEAAAAKRSAPIKAQTYRNKKWGSASAPVVLCCRDGHEYVVKGRQAGRYFSARSRRSLLGPLATFLIVVLPPIPPFGFHRE
jgi:hypothetical protein